MNHSRTHGFSTIYITLTSTFQVRPYESYKHLNSSKLDISLPHCYPFLFCFQVSRLLLRSSHYCEATWLIMAGSNQLTRLWISFLLRWWRTRAPWQKAQRVCLPATVTSTSKPFRDLDTFHYINPWTCFFNFETVYICECHIFTDAKLAHLENVSSSRDPNLYHT